MITPRPGSLRRCDQHALQRAPRLASFGESGSTQVGIRRHLGDSAGERGEAD